MSVLVLDLKAFSYLQNAIITAAYRSECDEYYSEVIRAHVRHWNVGVEEESERLIKSWLRLNEKSFDFRYPDEDTGESMVPFYEFKHTKVYPPQTLQYLICLDYNIEVLQRIENNEKVYYWDEPNKYGARKLDEQETKDYALLKGYKDDVAYTILKRLPEWKKLDYCDGKPFVPQGKGIFEGA
jgi:hypothetical protein